MNDAPRPSRLAQGILRAALPGERYDDIIGDLEEVFRQVCAERGPSTAQLWYWRAALMLSGRFLIERVRERSARGANPNGNTRTRSFRLAGLFGFSTIDVRLGVRMLVKHAGLTITSTVALAIAIAIIAGFLTATRFMVRPTLPLPDGERIVAIWQHDIVAGERGTQTLGDMLTWARDVTSLEHVGGFRLRERGVSVGGAPQIVRTAEITPSAFELTRVPPELGRPLVGADAQAGGPAIAVIGYDFWRTSFDADRSIVGRIIRIGGVEHTIVGVMPQGFAFPQSEEIWTPMPTSGAPAQPDREPAIDFAFARLAPGASLEGAEAELQVAAARLTAEYPQTHARLRPRIARYADSFLDASEPELRILMHAARMAVGVVLLIVAVNVGALIYARNAARMAEIAIRTALGASRRRIVLQMFVEALVLSSLAAVLGVGILLWPLARLRAVFDAWRAQGDGIPFWFDIGLSPTTVVIVVCLALLSAVLTGALPALKLTGAGVQAQLQRVQQGSSGLRFGRTTTLIVVCQVALSVALLTVGSAQLRSFVGEWWSRGDGGLARMQTLTAQLRWGRDADAVEDTQGVSARAQARRELGRRAASELEVQGVTFQSFRGVRFFASAAAGADDPPQQRLISYMTAIEPNFFDVMNLSIRDGRGLSAGDRLGAAAPVAIVNEAFIENLSISGDPIGQRIRALDPRTRQSSGAWLRIAGVVEDMPELAISHRGPEWLAQPTVYTPMPESASSARILIRSRGEPENVIGQLQALAADIDPEMIVHRAITMKEADAVALTLAGIYGIAVGFFVFAALLLSTTGVYAMMSFTTTQRTREIGIRAALGAPAARVVGAVFSRALKQLGVGTAVGLGLGYLAADGPFSLSGGLFADGPDVVIGVAFSVFAMGLIACGRPMRRALRVEPSVALRADD